MDTSQIVDGCLVIRDPLCDGNINVIHKQTMFLWPEGTKEFIPHVGVVRNWSKECDILCMGLAYGISVGD